MRRQEKFTTRLPDKLGDKDQGAAVRATLPGAPRAEGSPLAPGSPSIKCRNCGREWPAKPGDPAIQVGLSTCRECAPHRAAGGRRKPLSMSYREPFNPASIGASKRSSIDHAIETEDAEWMKLCDQEEREAEAEWRQQIELWTLRQDGPPIPGFTEAEWQVICRKQRGLSLRETAAEMGISHTQVAKLLASIDRKGTRRGIQNMRSPEAQARRQLSETFDEAYEEPGEYENELQDHLCGDDE